MRERDIEKILVDGVKKIGGKAFKFVSPGNDGVPDRIVIMPGGRVYFVELKTEVGRLSGRQKIQMRLLSRLGCEVWALWGSCDVRTFLRMLGGDDDIPTARISEAGCKFYPGT